jgi:hypothetical protein
LNVLQKRKRLLKWSWIANWGTFDKSFVFRIIRQLSVCTHKLAKKMCKNSKLFPQIRSVSTGE